MTDYERDMAAGGQPVASPLPRQTAKSFIAPPDDEPDTSRKFNHGPTADELKAARDAVEGPAQKIPYKPLGDMLESLSNAGGFVGHTIEHPIDTAKQIAANPGATVRTAARGVLSNVPFANEISNSVPGASPTAPAEDAAAAPAGIGDFAGVASMPAASKVVSGLASKAIESAAPVVSSFLSKVGGSAESRNVGRAMEDIEQGAYKKSRAGVRNDTVADVVRENPELRKAAGNDAKLAAATDTMKKQAADELDSIYSNSRAPEEATKEAARSSRKAADVAKENLHDERPLSELAREIDAPRAREPSLFELTRAIDAPGSSEAKESAIDDVVSKSKSDLAAKKTAAIDAEKSATSAENEASRPVDMSPSTTASYMDKRISDLKNGTVSDRAVAAKLQKIRDEFESSIGDKNAVSPQRMRAEQSAYQRNGYAKNLAGDPDVSATIAANREASKAIGDAVVEHVTGMKFAEAKAYAEANPDSIAAKLFNANDRISAANRIEATIADRASKPPVPTGPAAAIKRIATHAVVPALVGTTHGPGAGIAAAAIQEALHAAPGVARAIAKSTDAGLSGLAKQSYQQAIKRLAEVAAKTPANQFVSAAVAAGLPRSAAEKIARTAHGSQSLQGDVTVDTTKLSPSEESKYQAWKSTLPDRLKYEGDYDLRGFWKKNPNFSVDTPGQHMTDEFKLPNHPTFSDESRYYNEKTKHLGGHWEGDVYIPNDTRFKKRVDESPGAAQEGDITL